MKLCENVWNRCSECGGRKNLTQKASYGCDVCKKPIDDFLSSGNTRSSDYLEIVVFHDASHETDRYQFCSWACCFKKLRRIKTGVFVSLPFLVFEKKPKGQNAKDFFRCLKI